MSEALLVSSDIVATSERGFRALLVSMTAISLLNPILTFLLTMFGPSPLASQSKRLAPGIKGLIEPTDRAVVLTWWLIAISTALWFGAAASSRVRLAQQSHFNSPTVRVLLSLVAFVFAAQLMWDFGSPSTENVPQIEIPELVIASILAVLAVLFLASRTPTAPKWWWLAAGPCVVLFLPALIQSPATLRDGYHFLFPANELLAPSVGRFPLSSFVSQYSNFLGYPIAPLVNLLPPRYDLTVVVAYLLVLQFLCLLTPCWVALLAGKRLVTAFALCLPTFVFVTTVADRDEILSVSTYFQGFPLRVALPSALLTVLAWYVTVSPKMSTWGAVLTGGIATLTLLNNPEFGGPAALAAFIVITVSGRSLKSVSTNIFGFFVGAISVTITIILAFAGLGSTIRWSYLLSFAQIFGSAGFSKVPMAPGGLPVVIVTGFGLGILIGLYSLMRARQVGRRELGVSSALLMYASIWGLLSILYYSGRSLTSTAVGGHYFQLALVVSGVVLYLTSDADHVRTQLKLAGDLSKVAHIVGFAFFVLFTSALIRLPSPADSMASFWKAGAQLPSEGLILSEIARAQSRDLLPDDLSETGQLLPISNSIEHQTGAMSLLVVSHPSYYSVAPELTRLQCLEIRRSNMRFVIESGRYSSIFDDPSCERVFPDGTQVVYDSQTIRVVELNGP